MLPERSRPRGPGTPRTCPDSAALLYPRKQDPAFLDAVGARVALTPVGANNPYGHPAAATLQRLEQDGARTYRSDLDGDVAVVVRGGRLSSVGRAGDGVTTGPSAGGPRPVDQPAGYLPAVRRYLPVRALAGQKLPERLLPLAASAMTECDVDLSPRSAPGGGRSPPLAG